jgi:pimeloyl-ACP methyl ester carboxylesterase
MASKLIHVRRYGHAGPVVVLLHGGPGAAGEMAPVARRLSTRFNVLEPLQRGGGPTSLTVAAHVADLHEILQEPVQDAPVRLVGFSWGAMLALTYASRYAADVERVVAIGCGTFDARARHVYQTCVAERMDDETRSRVSGIQASLAGEKDQIKRNELFAEIGRIYTRLQSFDPQEDDTGEPPHCDEKAFRETWTDAVSLQEKGIQPAEFSRITAPVTMIHGEADPHPGRLIYGSLRPFIDQLTYIGIPRCGHTPWVERHAAEPFYAALIQSLT